MKIGPISHISRMNRDRKENPKEDPQQFNEIVDAKAEEFEREIPPLDGLTRQEIKEVNQMNRLKEMSVMYFSSVANGRDGRKGNMQNLLESTKFTSQHQFKGINVVG